MLSSLTEEEIKELDAILLAETPKWVPLAGPQTDAYFCDVDVLGYGGSAGGGKTDLAIGKALTQHEVTAIFRREGTELTAIHDRLEAILGSDDGFNAKDRIWKLSPNPADGVTARRIEYGSVPNLGNEKKYQGRPKDLLVLDEAANFLESQARFLMGWVRTTTPGQKCQVLMTFNPPTESDGRWIIDFFAPWLNPNHPNPAKPGEVRWFATIDGKDIEVDDGSEFEHNNEIVKPQSRTFIPSRVTDNPYLMNTGYVRTLQALPEPLRSQMLYGDFSAGTEDSAFQVIPSAWVQAAMDRWKPRTDKGELMSIGVDVARGGRDHTVIAKRFEGNWVDELSKHPGQSTPNGAIVAGIVVSQMRDRAPVHVDVIGVGASVYDHLDGLGLHAVPVNVSESSDDARDKSGSLKLSNIRTVLWWRMREALDPVHGIGIQLPPDQKLYSDLCTPQFKVRSGRLWVESKEEIAKRLQRSTDDADATLLAMIDTPKRWLDDEEDNGFFDDGRSSVTGY